MAEVASYTVLDPQGEVVNVILWDGNTATWSVTAAYGPGYTVRLATEKDAILTPAS